MGHKHLENLKCEHRPSSWSGAALWFKVVTFKLSHPKRLTDSTHPTFTTGPTSTAHAGQYLTETL